MTTTTPHGQVPEALIDLIDAYEEHGVLVESVAGHIFGLKGGEL